MNAEKNPSLDELSEICQHLACFPSPFQLGVVLSSTWLGGGRGMGTPMADQSLRPVKKEVKRGGTGQRRCDKEAVNPGVVTELSQLGLLSWADRWGSECGRLTRRLRRGHSYRQ